MNVAMQFRRCGRALAALAALSIGACGDGGDGGGGGGGAVETASVDVLLGDAPADELLALEATVREIRLVRGDGGATADLLPGEARVELLGLQDGPLAWLAAADVPAGTYTAIELRFDPAAWVAKDAAGAPVTVDAAADVFEPAFPEPVEVAADDSLRAEVDLDLVASLSGQVSSGTIVFDPAGEAELLSDPGTVEIEDLHGAVLSEGASTASLSIDAFAEADGSVPLGFVVASVEDTVLFLGSDGFPLADEEAFFAALVPGASFVEIEGSLDSDGVVQATRVEIEDALGGGSASPVHVEGEVVGVELDGFELLLREIEKGAAIAGPILASLDDPATIAVAFDVTTLFLAGDGPLASPEDLAVGQTVEVEFVQFLNEPFPAGRVEIADLAPDFDGPIVDVSGLPASFAMHLDPGEPALVSGDVASPTTDVVVELAGASLFLDTEGEPAILPDDLLVGLRVRAGGELEGGPASPVVSASSVLVRPGRLVDALVATVSPATSSFGTVGGDLLAPFGGGITPGPMTVLVDGETVFEGAVTSLEQFFLTADPTGSPATVTVDVLGIASGNPNEIRAYEVAVAIGGLSAPGAKQPRSRETAAPVRVTPSAGGD